MKLYKVPCYWEMYGYLFIDAEDEEDAKEIAYSETTCLPDNAEYVSDSFTVEHDWIERIS